MKIKKIITSLFIGILVLSGCGSNDKQTKVETPETVTVYVVRHGKTMLNTTDRSQGWIDAPLTPAGIEVAEFLGKGLKESDIKFDAVYTSTSGRTIETAEVVLTQMGQEKLLKELTKMTNFREYNFGTYEGMPNPEMWEAVATAQGITLEEWQAHGEEVGFAKSIAEFADTLAELDKKNVEPGVNWPAEDYKTIVKRSLDGLDTLVEDSAKKGNKDILLVSHGMTIITMAAELDPSAELPAGGIKNAAVTKIVYNVKEKTYTVEAVNDLKYVEMGQKK